MKNKFIKLCFAFLAATFLISPLTVFAATYPGDTFKVTLACGNIEGSINFAANNATITGGTGNWCDRGKSYTITAKAGSAGTATITIKAEYLCLKNKTIQIYLKNNTLH